MKILVNKDISQNILDNLRDFEVYFTEEVKEIKNSLSKHPDMQLFYLKERNEYVCDLRVIDHYKKFLDKVRPTFYYGHAYPHYISLNAVTFGNYFMHNLPYTDPYVLNHYRELKYKFIQVSQGYTKCNTLCGEGFLITSDKKIYDKSKNLTDALLIEPGNIKLKDFNYGFIGGATGVLKGEVYFTGKFIDNKMEDEVLGFLDKRNVKYHFLSEDPIEDFGSILPLE